MVTPVLKQNIWLSDSTSQTSQESLETEYSSLKEINQFVLQHRNHPYPNPHKTIFFNTLLRIAEPFASITNYLPVHGNTEYLHILKLF